MSVKILQRAEAQLAIAHDDLRKREDPEACRKHVVCALLLVREALADMVAPRPPRMGRKER